jgi:hypothetical protein
MRSNRKRAILITVGLALLAGALLLAESPGSIMAPMWGVQCCGEVPWLVSGLGALLMVGAALVVEAFVRHD